MDMVSVDATESLSLAAKRGSYEPWRYVVRLRDDLYDRLEHGLGGVEEAHKDIERTLAFSTYFHETIHLWQHVGSTSGLRMSLSYPAQAHVNKKDLCMVLSGLGPRKPIMRDLLAEQPGKKTVTWDSMSL